MIVLPVWKELLQWGPLLLGGAAMGSTVERVLGPCRSWPRRGALYLLLGFTLGLPAWVGDHNPILLFLPFRKCNRSTGIQPCLIFFSIFQFFICLTFKNTKITFL